MSTGKKQIENTAVEVNRLRQVELELKYRLNQQAAVSRLSYRALSSSDMLVLMDETVELVAETLNVELCKILEMLPGDKELKLVAGAGWEEGLVGMAVVSAGKESQAGYTLLTDQPVIVNDLNEETRFYGPDLLLSHGVVSGMSVIIPGKIKPFGVLGVHTRKKHRFTQDDATFLKNISNVLASAIIRLKAEDIIRSSRDQLAVILQGITEGITVQDQAGNLVYANQRAAELLGFAHEKDLLNSSISEVTKKFAILKEDGNSFPAEQLPGHKALAGEGESASVIRFRVLATGEERWSFVKATPIYNQSGDVDLAINIFQDITDLKRTEQQRTLLSEAGDLFASSLDHEVILPNVARLAVKHLSDWCIVHILEDENTIRQVGVEHTDPSRVELAKDLQSKYPPSIEAEAGLAVVLKTGKPEFFPEISEELIAETARDEEHKKLLLELGMKSAIILPLIARGRIMGSLTLIWAESGRRYGNEDVIMAEELARLAALALDNARLYKEAQTLNSELEKRVTKRTSQLQSMVNKLKNEVAERKKAEEALKQNEKILESLFESAPDGAILIDSDGIIDRVNAQAETLFGYPREELVGNKVEILLPDRYRRMHFLHRQNFYQEARTRTMGAGLDLFGRRKDGSEFPVDIMLSPVDTDEGIYVIAAVRDITERKKMEAELSEVQRRLFESLEAERLHLAQELHDGPIQELYGVTYSLNGLSSNEERASDENINQVREMVRKVISTLRTMCGDLRPPTLAPFGLEKAIRAHVEQFQGAHPSLDIQLDLTPDGQLLPERVRLALFRIYQHAVSNVRRHSNATQLEIRFGYDIEQVELEIRDNGAGFDLPSKWVDLARKGHFGLVGTIERAEAIGGQLKITSSPGKGTSIMVLVPLSVDGEPDFSFSWPKYNPFD
jgi:PAS domain S-box-containing protein